MTHDFESTNRYSSLGWLIDLYWQIGTSLCDYHNHWFWIDKYISMWWHINFELTNISLCDDSLILNRQIHLYVMTNRFWIDKYRYSSIWWLIDSKLTNRYISTGYWWLIKFQNGKYISKFSMRWLKDFELTNTSLCVIYLPYGQSWWGRRFLSFWASWLLLFTCQLSPSHQSHRSRIADSIYWHLVRIYCTNETLRNKE